MVFRKKRSGKGVSLTSTLIIVNTIGLITWTWLALTQDLPDELPSAMAGLTTQKRLLAQDANVKLMHGPESAANFEKEKSTHKAQSGTISKVQNIATADEQKIYWRGLEYVEMGDGRRRPILPSDLRLANLSCQEYGGPYNENEAQEMVYWQEIPSDHQYTSPFFIENKKKNPTETKYITFEHDKGGFNNIRMALETIMTLAHAMGRTLVLPPQQELYRLKDRKGSIDGQTQRQTFGMEDFFPIAQIAIEQAGLDIITMEEFLEREGMQGKLRSNDSDGTSVVAYPPHNKTDWNGQTDEVMLELYPYLRTISTMPTWNPANCLAAFPHAANQDAAEGLKEMIESIAPDLPDPEQFIGKPVAVYASVSDRFAENYAGRTELCMYDANLQEAKVVHFHGKEKLGGGRLLVHSYAFLFFENWRQDLWTKRFVRDHIRYVDEIQCAAARIVQAIRARVRERDAMLAKQLSDLGIYYSDGEGGITSNNGEFDAFHVRRGEFQYKRTRISSQEMYEVAAPIIPDRSIIYIATDERNKTFFDDLAVHYELVFLDDYVHLIKDINTNYYGMIDQLVASRSRVFFGCFFSTFSGYINRLRGYHTDRLKTRGFETGIIPSLYYAFPEHYSRMRQYWPVSGAMYAREFPVSWRNIDQGIGDLDKPYNEK